MTDYTKSTGTSGTMKIVDGGTVVTFWLKAAAGTYNHDLPWGFTVNGITSTTQTYDFDASGDWQKLKSWTVTTTQTVTFKIFDSQTAGLGGPTSFSVKINRATVPPPPNTPKASSITATGCYITFGDAGNGGSAITAKRLYYGTSVNSSLATIISSDGSTNFVGLDQGGLYRFWAQVKNDIGWSEKSARLDVQLLDVPGKPYAPTIISTSQTGLVVSIKDNLNDGGTDVIERQFAYWSATSGTTTVAYSGATPVETVVNGLEPYTSYTVQARTRNAVGWSAWSTPTITSTTAGAVVNVGGVWQRAVPYMNVDGTWVLVQPHIRVAGVWKATP